MSSNIFLKKEWVLISVLLLFCSTIESQSILDSVFIPRNTTESYKDTTIAVNNTSDLDFSYLCKGSYNKPGDVFITHYYSVFRFSNKNKFLKQWSTPIIIYFDRRISKKMKSEFMSYFDQINNVKNLIIVYTEKFEDANYFIKLTEKEFKGYGKSKKFESDEVEAKYPLTNVTYKLLTDRNNKFYGGILTMSRKELTNEMQALQKLKQVFFLSLGNFSLFPSKYKDNTLLSVSIKNPETFYKKDLQLLTIHYGLIYSQKINGSIFKKLEEFAQMKCENE